MHCSAFSPVAEERTANNGLFFVNLLGLDETYDMDYNIIADGNINGIFDGKGED